MRLRCRLLFLAVLLALGGLPARSQSGDGIHKIRHIVIIMQENRSFDTYFGTFPGADGIPMTNGVPSVCVPDPRGGSCVRPFYDTSDVNRGGPHNAQSAVGDVNGGRMDGFLERSVADGKAVRDPNAPNCAGAADVMGYHDGRQLVNYWRYARDFVLQDQLFEPNASWSLPQHLFMVSEWSACVLAHRRPNELRQRTAASGSSRPITTSAIVECTSPGARTTRGPILPICCTGATLAGPTT